MNTTRSAMALGVALAIVPSTSALAANGGWSAPSNLQPACQQRTPCAPASHRRAGPDSRYRVQLTSLGRRGRHRTVTVPARRPQALRRAVRLAIADARLGWGVVVAVERRGRVLVHRERRRAGVTAGVVAAGPFAPLAPSGSPPDLSRLVQSTLADANAELAAARRTSGDAAAALSDARAQLASATTRLQFCKRPPDCSAAQQAVKDAADHLAFDQGILDAAELAEKIAVAAVIAGCGAGFVVPVLGWEACLAALIYERGTSTALKAARRLVKDAAKTLKQANKALRDCQQGRTRAQCDGVSGVSGVAWRPPVRARLLAPVGFV